jgi:hypothetical protein
MKAKYAPALNVVNSRINFTSPHTPFKIIFPTLQDAKNFGFQSVVNKSTVRYEMTKLYEVKATKPFMKVAKGIKVHIETTDYETLTKTVSIEDDVRWNSFDKMKSELNTIFNSWCTFDYLTENDSIKAVVLTLNDK